LSNEFFHLLLASGLAYLESLLSLASNHHIKIPDEAEALQVANDTEYGLSSAVFTQDEGRGLRFALGIEAGMTHINDQPVNDLPNAPFGREKNSGIGRFGGDWIVEEFTTDHWITLQHTPRSYPF
jgi:aldehyde dehydrogenase (NAD+)